MGRSRDSSRKRVAETVSFYVSPALIDAEDDALRAEFAGLDLTEQEQLDLAEAWRLRRPAATNAERVRSRAAFARVRKSLDLALQATLDQASADLTASAIAAFEQDEQRKRELLEVALVRPQSNEAVDRINAQLAELERTYAVRRAAAIADVRPAAKVGQMAKSAAMRIHDRDGLAAVYERGKLTCRQFDAGRAYRKRYEAVSHGLGSALANLVSTGGRKVGSIDQVALTLAKWERQRSRVELAILRRADAEALSLMRRVAGEGCSVASVVGSGRAHGQGIKTLVIALDIAAPLLPQDA